MDEFYPKGPTLQSPFGRRGRSETVERELAVSTRVETNRTSLHPARVFPPGTPETRYQGYRHRRSYCPSPTNVRVSGRTEGVIEVKGGHVLVGGGCRGVKEGETRPSPGSPPPPVEDRNGLSPKTHTGRTLPRYRSDLRRSAPSLRTLLPFRVIHRVDGGIHPKGPGRLLGEGAGHPRSKPLVSRSRRRGTSTSKYFFRKNTHLSCRHPRGRQRGIRVRHTCG